MDTKGKFDELSVRMKSYYEDRTRILLPRRTYTVIRIDGKSFKNYTKGLNKPFDDGLINDMDETAIYLCKNIQGAKFGFVQSDEISILLTDFEKIGTDAWFDGNIQKMASISSSMAAAKFNQLRWIRYVCDRYNNTPDEIGWVWFMDAAKLKLATFDARVFTIPSDVEVENYFIWRQQDTVRNSISSVAQSLYSHKELNGKSSNEQQEMIFQKGINWNDYAPKYKRGRFILKEEVQLETPFISEDKCQHSYTRTVWRSGECPIFTQDREFLISRIPKND